MIRKTPTVWVVSWGQARQAAVQVPGSAEQDIELDTAGWQAWLERASTHSFAYPIDDRQAGYIRGFMTVRKEKRRRGSEYWVAYRRVGKQVRKVYLGRAVQLTQQQLAATAERFLALEEARARGGSDIEKEVMPGQMGGVSLKREAMIRRVKWSHRMVHIGQR
jgi:hypothetical protein